jgi:hypothetical protein
MDLPLRTPSARAPSFHDARLAGNYIALCKVMYHEYAFGAQQITWKTIETPPTPADALEVLEHGQRLLVQDLSTLSKDEELNIPRLTNWGEESGPRDAYSGRSSITMLTTVEKSVVSAIFISAGSALAMMHIKRGVVRQSPVNGIPIAEYIHEPVPKFRSQLRT